MPVPLGLMAPLTLLGKTWKSWRELHLNNINSEDLLINDKCVPLLWLKILQTVTTTLTHHPGTEEKLHTLVSQPAVDQLNPNIYTILLPPIFLPPLSPLHLPR
jgi:hypothetical protein